MQTDRSTTYHNLFQRLDALCDGETDDIALMATISCEVYHSFESFNWVGFYRKVGPELLKVGPYQGGHGCLSINFQRGICGRAARQESVLNIPDVRLENDHIACSSTTLSELVIPVFDRRKDLLAIFDVDSDTLDNFSASDERSLAGIQRYFTLVG